MSASSTQSKNEIAMQRDIFRLAAALYTSTNDTYSTATTQIEVVKCIFFRNENAFLSIDEVISELLEVFKYHIAEDELISIFKRNGKVFVRNNDLSTEKYQLENSLYQEMQERQEKDITYFVNAYIDSHSIDNPEQCRDAVYKYLYELTTTNINSYKILLNKNEEDRFSDSELSVNVDELTEEERALVHGFLDWDNAEKNIALGNVVFCCLEYCLLVNGDSPNNILCTAIRNRDVYIDTNVIFRALGINGKSRKRVVDAFLSKCKQAKIRLIISSHTKREFQEAISYYVSEIKSYPRGTVYLGMYESISDYSIFSFYDDWVQEHQGMSLEYFTAYINSLYIKLVEQYGIIDNVKIPDKIYHSEKFRDIRNAYSSSIRAKKQELRQWYEDEYYGYSKRDSHDASVIRHIELLREECDDEKDIFFVSSDKSLRYWDMTRHGTSYPVVIYPSQLFLILIKLCGRSENDFDSFVSFINIRPKTHQLTAEKANVIIAGISTITEDIQAQKILASAVFGEDFQNIIKNSNTDADLYLNVQRYSQNYLEEELKQKDDKIAILSEADNAKAEEIDRLKVAAKGKEEVLEQERNALAQKAQELEAKREKVCKFAERKILPTFLCKHYLFPITICLYWMAFVLFVTFQFFFCDKEWNLVTSVLEWLDTTTFGKKVGDALYAIDLALFGLGCFISKFFFQNPFNKKKLAQDKAVMVERYIKKHDLF